MDLNKSYLLECLFKKELNLEEIDRDIFLLW